MIYINIYFILEKKFNCSFYIKTCPKMIKIKFTVHLQVYIFSPFWHLWKCRYHVVQDDWCQFHFQNHTIKFPYSLLLESLFLKGQYGYRSLAQHNSIQNIAHGALLLQWISVRRNGSKTDSNPLWWIYICGCVLVWIKPGKKKQEINKWLLTFGQRKVGC